MFAVSVNYRSGIILCKTSHAQWVGPGSAVSADLDKDCWGAIALGPLHLSALNSLDQQKQAYERRDRWLRWLQQTIYSPTPLQRAANLLTSLDAFFGNHVTHSLPMVALAQLAAVPLPVLLDACQDHYPLSLLPVSAQGHCPDVASSPWRWLVPQELGLVSFAPRPPALVPAAPASVLPGGVRSMACSVPSMPSVGSLPTAGRSPAHLYSSRPNDDANAGDRVIASQLTALGLTLKPSYLLF